MNRIKKVRQEKNLTLDDLEELTGINKVSINRYENAKVEPNLKTWKKLAETLDVSPAYLMGIEDSKVKFPEDKKHQLAVYLGSSENPVKIRCDMRMFMSKMTSGHPFTVSTVYGYTAMINPNFVSLVIGEQDID